MKVQVLRSLIASVVASLWLASAGYATPLPNSAVLHLRVFNDCPISILNTVNAFPGSIVIDDQNVPPQPLCAGFANLHTWRFSTDGVNALQFLNGDAFEYSCVLVLNGAGEGGLNLSPWFSPDADGLFNVRTTDGEIACFGGRTPVFRIPVALGVVDVHNTPLPPGVTDLPHGPVAASPAHARYKLRFNH